MKKRKVIASESVPVIDETGYTDESFDPKLGEDQVDETTDDDNPGNEIVSGISTEVPTNEKEQAFNDSITKEMKKVLSLKTPK